MKTVSYWQDTFPLFVFLLAFLASLSVIGVTGSYRNPETWEYEVIANNILKGNGYSIEHLGTNYLSFAPPLYPLLSAATYYLTGHSQFALLIVQALCFAFTSVLIFYVSQEIVSFPIPALASLFTVFHPGLLFYVTHKLHSFSIDILLITLVAWMFLKLQKEWSNQTSLWTGVVLGFCLLARPTIGLFFLVVSLWCIWAAAKGQKRRVVPKLGLVFLLASIVIAPWVFRNIVVHKKFIFTQSLGETFWRGNNPNATGSTYTPEGKTILEVAPPEFLRKVYSLDEAGQDSLFWHEAFRFIQSDPWGFLKLTAQKFYYFWWFSPQTGILYPSHWLQAYKMFYAPALLFSLWGMFLVFQEANPLGKKHTILMIGLLLSISGAQSLFYVEARHRWAVEPIWLIFSARGLYGTKRVFGGNF